MSDSVFAHAARCIEASDPDAKIALTRAAAAAWRNDELCCDTTDLPAPIGAPGRPPRPELVDPADVPCRKLGSAEGRAALIHAVAHIEFNAINLAWDAVYRFRGLPPAYYGDWVRVAEEEAHHFELLRGHLRALGYDYGAFTAHNGLWEMAVKTADDALARMALVPRVLEARGLDVTPGMIRRLEQAGDQRAADILRIILREEVGHVAVGTRWFEYLCARRGLEREPAFEALVRRYVEKRGARAIDRTARTAAGFTEREMHFIESGMGV